MLLPSLLPFAILAVAVSIPEPLPIFGPFCGTPAPVYANGTKAANWTDYIASFETLPSPGGQGITDAWGNDGGPIPWPRTGTHQAVIPYCFTQEWDRRYIRNIVENGMAKWIEHLGGPASEEARHAISFQERKDTQGKPLYCGQPNNRDAWNPNVPHDTVAFEYSDDRAWGASMAHEHNRADRDTWVKIDFRHLVDWPACWARARSQEGLAITPTDVCTSMPRALKYGCSCSGFIKNHVEPGWTINSHSYYDLASIMHYASVTGYSNTKCIEEGEDCPVMAYVDAERHELGTRLLEQVRKPSSKDLVWVKKTYPWKEEE
ncbi:uncharacterized protein SETTUDRAFT_141322 [Exserohilum turcica Et28A]|uniref:Peptidase M12A domain-containing protein n=1 Tax=Exserohilum turcicum (strain 28A) TaxID=671987 RepID=R0JZQ4_EXST2|nr:uncharacterized protein SETTUDRAFT_141322 [Exserohilum turcica Et28A]EOA82939.1 hypothetical protein SETTUDRAFT_141322 [Exserohilum turcica Et28A]